jgi:pilus assembly protein Flp/PilA
MRLATRVVLSVLRTLLRRNEGQDLVEYALVLGLIATAAVASLRTVAAPVNTLIAKSTTALTSA